MTATAPADRVWADFLALSSESRDLFLTHLVHDEELRSELEDHLDLELIRVRAGEPTRSLNDVLNSLDS